MGLGKNMSKLAQSATEKEEVKLSEGEWVVRMRMDPLTASIQYKCGRNLSHGACQWQ